MRRLKSRDLVPLLLVVLLTGRVPARERQQLDLSIIGTKVESDTTGLPARLEGMVFFRGGPRDGLVAGTYSETLKPLMDPVLGLVGTVGESVFRFVKRDGDTVGSDRVVTINRSEIVGEIARDGALLVESTGRVVGGGPADGSGGTLRSRATVRLGKNFELDVEVTLILGVAAKDVRSPSPEGDEAGRGHSLLVTVGAAGETRVRYGRDFKRGLVERMTGPDAVSAAELSVETGLSEALLARWGQQARLLAMLQKVHGALRPTPRERTFEEKLGAVIRTAGYSEEELEDFVALEGVSREELVSWRHAIDTALEEGSREKGKSDTERGKPAEEEDSRHDAQGLEDLKQRVEALLGDGSSG